MPKIPKVVNVNMLRCWHTADGTVRTVVVADEMDDPSPPDNVVVNVLSDDQVAHIKQIHSSFLSLFSEYTGSTSLIKIILPYHFSLFLIDYQ